jgi:hypothetical protein
VCGVWGHKRVGGLRQIKYLPQRPFTGQFFLITAFGIEFYQSNLSTVRNDGAWGGGGGWLEEYCEVVYRHRGR